MKTSTTCSTCGKTIPELPKDYAYCVACRYDSPVKPSSFTPNEYDIACDTVAAPAVDDHEPDGKDVEFAQKLAAFLEWLASDGSHKTAGKKVILISYIAGRTTWETDAQVASALGITKGRISQLREEIDQFLPGFGRCNRRQTKPRRTSG